MLTAATAFYIAFAELFNDTVKRDVLPLGQLTWLQNLLHSAAVPYDVQRTEARGFGTTGIEQRTVSFPPPGRIMLELAPWLAGR